MQTWLAIHSHKYGQSHYFFKTALSKVELDTNDEKVASQLEIEYEPELDESIEFIQIEEPLITVY